MVKRKKAPAITVKGKASKSSNLHVSADRKNGGPDNENKQTGRKQIETDQLEASSSADVQGDNTKSTPQRGKKGVAKIGKTAKQGAHWNALVTQATLIEDGNAVTLKLSKEQDAEFDSAVDDNPRGVTDSDLSDDENEVAETSKEQYAMESSQSSVDGSMDSSEGTDESEQIESPECNRGRKVKKSKRPSPSPCKRSRERGRKRKRSMHRQTRRNRHDRSRSQIVKAFRNLEDMMSHSGYLHSGDKAEHNYNSDEECYRARRCKTPKKGKRSFCRESEMTIYKPAVKPARGSMSSEGMIDTSNETVELDLSTELENNPLSQPVHQSNFVHNLISEYCRRSGESQYQPQCRVDQHEQRSRASPYQERSLPPPRGRSSLAVPQNSGRAQRVAEAIREAKASKARIFEISGNQFNVHQGNIEGANEPSQMDMLSHSFAHSMLVDEQFLLVATHVDGTLRNKIVAGEYVKFLKLLSRDKLEFDEDQCMEMVNRDGKPVWVPVSAKDTLAINSFNRWEQAFRVFTDIFIKAHPSRTQEYVPCCRS